MKIKKLPLLLFLLIIISLVLFFYLQKIKNNKKIIIPDKISITDVSPEARDTQYMLNHLIRGKITFQNSNSITIKEDQFFTSGQELTFKVSKQQTVFCWTQKKDSIDISTSLLTLPEGSNLYMKDEIESPIENLPSLINKYSFIQIDDNENIVKLVILGCFDD